MADQPEPLLVKRYASRRLYNTETSDYVTLEHIAEVIRSGREVRIIDLKSGDDLTRQYLLQIIAEHESRGQNVLPVNVLTDLVRSYTTQTQSLLPHFLSKSFEIFRENQAQWVASMTKANPLNQFPGMATLRAQQEAFLSAWLATLPPASDEDATDNADEDESLEQIRAQLAQMQKKLDKLEK